MENTMIKIIGIVTIFAIVAILIFAAMQPSNFRVQRSTTIKASPEKVFALINDFHHWAAWSPWLRLSRATSMPAATRASSCPSLDVAGPRVQTILARRTTRA